MKTVYLIRHAKSSWDDPSLTDFDRPLNGRGRRAAPAMGAFMRSEGLVPQLALCSAARRTTETWALVREALEAPVEEVGLRELYGADPETILELLRGVPEALDRVVVVGHNPGLEETISLLSGDGNAAALRTAREKVPTGSLAVIHLPDGLRWREVAPGRGFLERFIRPADLIG